MIEYIIISYAFMLIFLVWSVFTGEFSEYIRPFLIAPITAPIYLIELLLRLINWAFK